MRKAKISHFPASLPSFADKASVPNMPRRRRVAVCADDSPGSMRACRYAAQHLIDKDTDVVLVTAVHPTPTTNPAVRPRARAPLFSRQNFPDCVAVRRFCRSVVVIGDATPRFVNLR